MNNPMTANPLLALAEKWNALCKSAESNIGIGPDEARGIKRCAAELTALAAAHEGMVLVPVVPTEEMVTAYAAAVAEHLGALTPKQWEIERFDPVAAISRTARIGLTAAIAAAARGGG